ncbi:hypothetical protein [Nonomuraea roseola]|uniref:Uncharacterized protein n=1 Tax=Nonomuraea roseola TaxID=46179 RepID=A0ABV5PV98_9ACTN
MNDLEERLRAALDARAQTYETSPTAWLRVQERRRGPLRRWGVVLVALPVALVALLVPVLLGGFQDRQVTMGPPPKPTPVGQALVIDNPAENRPMRLWFARNHEGALVFCRDIQYAGGAGTSGCGDDLARHEGDAAWREGSTESVPPRENVLVYGAARENVAKVTAVTKDGKRLDGALYRPSGAPLQAWTVTHPSTQRIGHYEFAGADGSVLARVESQAAMLPESAQGKPAGPAVEMKGMSVRPYLTPDRTLIWTRGGREVGLNFVRAKDLMTDMGGKRYPVELRVNGDRWFGIARKGTAKVTLARKGGASLEATVRTDPWKVGVSLFAGELPGSGDPYLEGFELVGSDSSGKVLWREDHPADRPKWDPHPPIGEVVTIGAAKVWFSKVTLADGRTWDGLCRSVPGKATTCDAFQPIATHYAHRLPDLGTIAIGVAGTGITQVTAEKSGTKGTIHAPAGAPLKIWAVPYQGGMESFNLRDPAGDLGISIGGVAPSGCSASPPVGRAATLAGGVTVTHQDGCLIMWREGQQTTVEMRDFEDATYTHGDEIFAGIAIKGTARVEMVYQDGSRLVAAATTPDPWGLGLVLFSTPSKKAEGGALVIGYDAAGKEFWRLD